MNKSFFRGLLTILLLCLAAAFLGYAAFGQEYSDPADRVRLIDTVVGFILGAAITPLVQFYFGSSQGSKDKTDKLLNNDLVNSAKPNTEEET